MSFIDKTFKRYGEEFFGKRAMDRVTPEQVEEARVFAFKELAVLTAEIGKCGPNTVKALFCNYVFEKFM